jgi:hypothetical protein
MPNFTNCALKSGKNEQIPLLHVLTCALTKTCTELVADPEISKRGESAPDSKKKNHVF